MLKNNLQNITMKKSGVNWIGTMPSDWELLPMRASLKERKKKNIGNKVTNILSVMKDVGVVRYEDKGNVGNKSSSRPESYKIVYPNDIVANSMNLVIGSVGISRELGVTSSVYLIYYVKDETVNIDFFNYVFRTQPFQKHLALFGRGIMELRESIKQQDIKVQLVPTPSKKEQEKIVEFLDEKTENISRLIEKKKKMIELLKEKRFSIITHAVTKGLDLSVEMKDSGVDWIGDVPDDWNIRKIKEIFTIKRGRVIAKTELDVEYSYPVYSSQTKNNGILGMINTYDFNEDLLTWTTDGALAGTIFRRSGKFNCTNVCGVLMQRQKQENSLNYLLYSVQHSALENRRPDTNGAKIMSGEMKNIKICYPNIDTQTRIAKYLDKKTSEIDDIISRIEKQIKLLNEYRASLIYHAVTGKMMDEIVKETY
jgi:type I restriction enzyme S subunit